MLRILPLAIACLALVGCGGEDEAPDTAKSAIAFVCAGGSGICVLSADGDDEAQLVENMHTDSPSWSPDGGSIAFGQLGFYDTETAGFIVGDDIYVVGVDGNDLRAVTEGPERDMDPAWSPDGKRIVFASDRDLRLSPDDAPATGSLYTINVDGTDIRRLTHGEDDHDPAWSPDGTRIAYIRDTELWVMDADGKDGRHLPLPFEPFTYFPSAPTWSPDGKQIAFEGTGSLHVINQDGTGLRRLVAEGRAPEAHRIRSIEDPTWSADGELIAFSAWDDIHDCTAIFVVKPDGSGRRRLSDCSRFDYQSPAWRPQSQSLT